MGERNDALAQVRGRSSLLCVACVGDDAADVSVLVCEMDCVCDECEIVSLHLGIIVFALSLATYARIHPF